MFLHKTILTISNVGVGKPATRGAISWSMVLGRWTICGEIAAFTKLNPWQGRHVNMPVLMSSCILLHGDLLKPWSYYLVEEQWTFSTVFNKIMRGELSSSESEAYAVDIDQTEHRLVKVLVLVLVVTVQTPRRLSRTGRCGSAARLNFEVSFIDKKI